MRLQPISCLLKGCFVAYFLQLSFPFILRSVFCLPCHTPPFWGFMIQQYLWKTNLKWWELPWPLDVSTALWTPEIYTVQAFKTDEKGAKCIIKDRKFYKDYLGHFTLKSHQLASYSIWLWIKFHMCSFQCWWVTMLWNIVFLLQINNVLIH